MPSFNTRHLGLALVASLGLGACAAESFDEFQDAELDAERQEFVQSINGLKTVNGLKTNNGLKTINGLTTTNGLKTANGLTTVNGLKTANGLKTMNGLDVDCTGKVLGTTCTGAPDGLMSARTGLMASDGGIATAKYLVRCALPAGQSTRIKDYTGALVTLNGELGLAPTWADGQCDTVCQEKVSACLLAFTNGKGDHIDIEMSAPFTLGLGHSSLFKYQEAAFYGNLFLDQPKAFYCVGKDFAKNGTQLTLLETRSCTGYNETSSSCPYVRTGTCDDAIALDLSVLLNDERCKLTGTSLLNKDTASSCTDGSKTWNYPITTFRKLVQ